MKRAGAGANKVRIIGGLHRGRKLAFPDLPGLRPTADRVRETLFNWLQPLVPGSRCLDLFAGSGALGLEALSRGAEHVLFVDKSGAALRQILRHLEALQLLARADTRWEDALRLLAQAPGTPFDIAFVDPPFGMALLGEIVHLLDTRAWLSPEAFVYLEHNSLDSWPKLPTGWLLYREGEAGQAAYRLMKAL